ncbi:MAG TPA: FAD-binding oxidoreductase, partial [Terriglobales bacterium]|nr:FAD-binding oxidoreductase [Terriglobales bacterium]
MTITANLSARLESLLGSERVLSSESDSRIYAIEDCIPAAVVKPANAQEVAEVVRFAAAENLALVCCGSRSKLNMGLPPRRYDVAVDLTALTEIVHYDPEDLTLSVDAGLPLASLADVLAARGQFLPLSVPFFKTSTVGGSVASGIDSMLRLQYGASRDFLIGAEFVDGKGQLCKSGGRVVKNVTGYDIHKLLIGSLGTLAAITRLNFRTFPLPETSAGHLAGFSTPETALAFRKSVLASGLPFSGVQLFDPGFAELLSGKLREGNRPAAELLDPPRWFVYAF